MYNEVGKTMTQVAQTGGGSQSLETSKVGLGRALSDSQGPAHCIGDGLDNL